jgi:hypothetical protein
MDHQERPTFAHRGELRLTNLRIERLRSTAERFAGRGQIVCKHRERAGDEDAEERRYR